MAVSTEVRILETKLDIVNVAQRDVKFQFYYSITNEIKCISLSIHVAYYGSTVVFKRETGEKFTILIGMIQMLVNEADPLSKLLHASVNELQKKHFRCLETLREKIGEIKKTFDDTLKEAKEIMEMLSEECPEAETEEKVEAISKDVSRIKKEAEEDVQPIMVIQELQKVEKLRLQVATVTAFRYVLKGLGEIFKTLTQLEPFLELAFVEKITENQVSFSFNTLQQKVMWLVLVTAGAMTLEAFYGSLCNLSVIYDEEKKEIKCKLGHFIDQFVECTAIPVAKKAIKEKMNT